LSEKESSDHGNPDESNATHAHAWQRDRQGQTRTIDVQPPHCVSNVEVPVQPAKSLAIALPPKRKPDDTTSSCMDRANSSRCLPPIDQSAGACVTGRDGAGA